MLASTTYWCYKMNEKLSDGESSFIFLVYFFPFHRTFVFVPRNNFFPPHLKKGSFFMFNFGLAQLLARMSKFSGVERLSLWVLGVLLGNKFSKKKNLESFKREGKISRHKNELSFWR